MARAHGKNAVFSLDDSSGTLRTLTTSVDNVSGLPGARELSEVTAFGDGGVKNIPGLVNVQFTVSGSWENTATTGPIAVLNSLMTATATATFEYGPDSSTSGRIKYTGECWLSGFEVAAAVHDKVPFSATFQVDGVVTVTTY